MTADFSTAVSSALYSCSEIVMLYRQQNPNQPDNTLDNESCDAGSHRFHIQQLSLVLCSMHSSGSKPVQGGLSRPSPLTLTTAVMVVSY